MGRTAWNLVSYQPFSEQREVRLRVGVTTTRSGWQALDCLGESLTAVRCIFKAAAVQLANGAQSTCRGSIHRIAMKDAVSAQRVEISVQCHLWPTLWSEEIRFILDVLNPMNLAGPQRCS